MMRAILPALCGLALAACGAGDATAVQAAPPAPASPIDNAANAGDHPFWLGADLSYVNEMEDCGAVYRTAAGEPVDPFVLLARKGGNIVRVRIWNDATWTDYSDYDDVLKTIRRAHAAGLQVLLDFHYSDDWADGEKQRTPGAWVGMSTQEQADALYAYTRDILGRLDEAGEMPELVQVGNETNPEILGGTIEEPIDWQRNARLLNAGIKAVRDAGEASGTAPKVMLHIAQPENVIPWFDDATIAGVIDYDIIGISYYKKWSKASMAQLGGVIAETRARYHADVMVVETAYPFTNDGADGSPNLLGPDTLIEGYPATPQGQLHYLEDLTRIVARNGGVGVVYWEPAWVSTDCKTRWGTGSNWENAAWFGLERHEALPAFDFLSEDYPRE